MKLPRCNGPLPRVRCAGVSKRPALVSRSSSPFDCHHPCRSSSFPSRFSYLAQLVRVGLGTVRCKVQYGQCTRCGALFQSQPRSSRGPRCVSERERVSVSGRFPRRELHSPCHARALFPPGHASGGRSRFSNVLAVRRRSEIRFIIFVWVAWAPLLSLPLKLRMGSCQIRIITNRHL